MKYHQMKIDSFRKFKDITFDFGKRITVISGENGIGKSSLLSLISSTTGVMGKSARLNGTHFNPEFSELFKISKDEKHSEYHLLIDFDEKVKEGYYLTKRIGFKDDTAANRGIRPLPRASVPISNPNNLTYKQAAKDVKETFGITESKRIQVPTVYLSLSRLFPVGETEISVKLISRNNNIYKNKYTDFFADCYNSVLPGSIDKDNIQAFFVEKRRLGKKHLVLLVKDTTNDTQSVGQDNLSSIVSALTDFYALKMSDPENYNGGVLCIDEIDASFHPSAVLAIWDLLKHMSEELDLQIVLTTHSLIILQKIIEMEELDSSSYRLVYFKDVNQPRISSRNSYELLKADLFDMVSAQRPKIKTYCEDIATLDTFKLLLKCAKELGLVDESQEIELDVVDLSLGKNMLKTIVKKDKYFRSTLIVLDGDARVNSKIDYNQALSTNSLDIKGYNTKNPQADNIIFLPTFYPPEIFLLSIIKDYANNYLQHTRFWKSLETYDQDTSLYTSVRVQRMFKTDENISFSEIHDNNEKWVEMKSFVEKTNILKDYYSDKDSKSNLIEFVKHYEKAQAAISKSVVSKIFD